MAIKNIIFDFGGVLIDWSPRYLFEKIIEDSDELDFFLDNVCTLDWNFEQDRGRSLAEGTRILQNRNPKYHDLIQVFYDRWEEMIKSEITDNVDVLTQIKVKYPVYGLTNFSEETLPRARKMYSFFDLFDGIVCSGTEKMVKPDAEIYELLLERYDLLAEECVFIDDNKDNIDAAIKLGFHGIRYTPEVNLKEELTQLGVNF